MGMVYSFANTNQSLSSIKISGDRARIPSPVNDLSPKTWRFVTRFTSQS